MKFSTRQKLLFFTLIILAGNWIIGYAVYKSNEKRIDAEQWVKHTEKVINQSTNILSLTKDIETAARGFIITDDSTFLEPLYAAKKIIFVNVEQLRQLTQDNPAQQQRVDSLNFYVHKRLDFSLLLAELRSKKGLVSAIAKVATGQGKLYTDHLRNITNAIQQEEFTLLKQRKQTTEESMATFNRVILFMFILMQAFTILLLFTFLNILRKKKEIEKQTAELVIAKELNLALEKLRESEEGFRTLADSISQFVWITQADGMNIYFNKQWTEYTGLTLEQSYGKGWNTPFHPDDKQLAWNAWNNATENNGRYDIECRLRQYNGAYHWFVIKAEPLLNNSGVIIKWYGTCTNIDNQKQIEQEIKTLNEELEIKVAKRTSQLQSANKELVLQYKEKEKQAVELIIAKDRAEESERLKSAFLANMSHEIRTPMNGILGFTELLKKPELPVEKQQKYISMIEKGGERLLNIINDLISISIVESGQMEISISETNINEQIKYLYTFFNAEAESKGIQLFFNNSLPDKEAFLKTDREKVYAVLTNLVKNAIKFTQTGFIKFGYVKKDEYLEFFVEDTGVGIRSEQMKIVFERFKQGSESLNRNYEGSGLGLSIAKAYVEMLGGTIWVESEVGKGSTFYFTIPYITEPDKNNIMNSVVVAEGVETRMNYLKILIAEDDELSAMLQQEIVGNFSRDIVLAVTGTEAIEACHSNPDIDLILIDMKMPEMDGFEATRQIRLFNKDVIIIAQTAYAFESDRKKAIAAGCNDYISKPIKKALLIEMMEKYFSKYQHPIKEK